jgi:hypothetical protein
LEEPRALGSDSRLKVLEPTLPKTTPSEVVASGSRNLRPKQIFLVNSRRIKTKMPSGTTVIPARSEIILRNLVVEVSSETPTKHSSLRPEVDYSEGPMLLKRPRLVEDCSVAANSRIMPISLEGYSEPLPRPSSQLEVACLEALPRPSHQRAEAYSAAAIMLRSLRVGCSEQGLRLEQLALDKHRAPLKEEDCLGVELKLSSRPAGVYSEEQQQTQRSQQLQGEASLAVEELPSEGALEAAQEAAGEVCSAGEQSLLPRVSEAAGVCSVGEPRLHHPPEEDFLEVPPKANRLVASPLGAYLVETPCSPRHSSREAYSVASPHYLDKPPLKACRCSPNSNRLPWT